MTSEFYNIEPCVSVGIFLCAETYQYSYRAFSRTGNGCVQ